MNCSIFLKKSKSVKNFFAPLLNDLIKLIEFMWEKSVNSKGYAFFLVENS